MFTSLGRLCVGLGHFGYSFGSRDIGSVRILVRLFRFSVVTKLGTG